MTWFAHFKGENKMLFAELARSMSYHNRTVNNKKRFDMVINVIDNLIHCAIENGKTYTRINLDYIQDINISALQDYLKNFGYTTSFDKEKKYGPQYMTITW